MLVANARNLLYVSLVTQKEPVQNSEQERALNRIKESLRRHNITLNVEYQKFHDRSVKYKV